MRESKNSQAPKMRNANPKYAQHANTTAVVELAKAAHGNMFDSADEQDEFDPAVRIPAPSPLATASPPPVATPPSTQTLPAAVAVTLEEEPIPQAVHDVIKDIVRNRSKTPIAAEQSGDFVEPPSKLARLEENSEQVNTAEVVEAPQPGDSMQITDTVVVETSEQGPSTSKPVAAKRPAARRTVKKPVTWQKKPTS
uniref:Uncharacterized protein n=1 Tax=Caenorhabditis japonica TaxID=281687 RepID=A0A8R1HKX3_CAEJA